MAGMDVEALTAPLSAEEPCGPDLDLEGDPDYLNFFARAEGLLPASYFRDGKPFDRASIDFNAEFAAFAPLLERTRDIRLLTLLARFHILNRDAAGFLTTLEAVAKLLDEQWDAVHPRGEGGDFMMRMTAIETLDDAPTVTLPMQFLPLAVHRRHGAITFRAQMIAAGEARAPEGEETLDLASVERALMEVDLPPLVESLNQFDAMQTQLSRLRSVWIDRAGFDQAVNLEKSAQLAGRIVAFVNAIVIKRDPSMALAGAQAAETPAGEEGAAAASGGAPTTHLTSRAEVADALAAASGYFARAEPSNPALMLLRQAEQLVGRSFADAMRILVPGYFDQAAIAIGTTHVFDLPIERLSNFTPEGEAPPTEETSSDSSGWGESEAPAASSDDSWGSSESEPANEEAASGDGEAAASEESASDGWGQSETASESLAAPAASTPPAAAARPRATTRQQAFTLLDQVAAYYRVSEPTSPVPFLLEQARRLAERDFMYLLREFLPESTLRSTTPQS